MENIFNNDWRKIPNLVSIFRILFIPIVFFLFEDINSHRWYIITLIILFALFDNLDGYLARKLNQVTELGKIIDPLVDKLFIITITILLYLHKLLPFWFIVIVILRDLLIMSVGFILLKKIERVPASDFIGKLTVGAIGVIFIFSLLNFQVMNKLFDVSLYICSFLILISLINYGYKQIIRER